MLPQAKPQETRMLKLHKQESKRVSVDDGFTAIPNEFLEAILKSGVLGWKGSYLFATVLKTLKWHKESDWFSHSQVCEMMGIEPNKYHINQLSAARTELLKAKILFEDGRNTGVNLAVFEWSMVIPDKVGKSRKSRELNPENVGNAIPEKVGNTKETITKYKINTPHTPQGDVLPLVEPQAVQPDENFAKSQELVDYYNELNKTKVRDGKPFIALLKNTSSRKGYSVDEIKLVLKWVHHTWKKRNGSIPSPTNICRPTRFDGYLADAQRWAEVADFDTQAVIQAYNDILGDKLVPLDEDDTDAEQQILALLPKLAHQTVDAFSAYFRAFANNASEFYFEPSHKIGFSFLMKPETLTKVKRGEI